MAAGDNDLTMAMLARRPLSRVLDVFCFLQRAARFLMRILNPTPPRPPRVSQVKELLGHVGLSRIAGRLAKNGVDYVRLLSLKQANLGGPGQTLDVRWPTAMGGFKWIKLYLPRWGCHLDDVKRLRFRIRSIEAPRMARAKQLLEFRANVGKKKYAALAAEVKMVFEQLALSPSGSESHQRPCQYAAPPSHLARRFHRKVERLSADSRKRP